MASFFLTVISITSLSMWPSFCQFENLKPRCSSPPPLSDSLTGKHHFQDTSCLFKQQILHFLRHSLMIIKKQDFLNQQLLAVVISCWQNHNQYLHVAYASRMKQFILQSVNVLMLTLHSLINVCVTKRSPAEFNMTILQKISCRITRQNYFNDIICHALVKTGISSLQKPEIKYAMLSAS